MTSRSASIAWRNSLRARSLHATRWSQRPALLPKRPDHVPAALRYASDSAPAAETVKEAAKDAAKEAPKEIPKKAARGSKKGLYGTTLALALLVGYIYGTDTRASAHRYAIVPLIRMLYPDAEEAHHVGVDMLKQLYRFGLHPRERGDQDGDGALATEVGILFSWVYKLRVLTQYNFRFSATKLTTLSVFPPDWTSTPIFLTSCLTLAPALSKLAALLLSPKREIPSHACSVSHRNMP